MYQFNHDDPDIHVVWEDAATRRFTRKLFEITDRPDGTLRIPAFSAEEALAIGNAFLDGTVKLEKMRRSKGYYGPY
jgi:hypothetical protein